MVDIEHLTQDDVMTPETLWTCDLGTTAHAHGHGPDSLYAHLSTHKDLIGQPADLSIGYKEQS